MSMEGTGEGQSSAKSNATVNARIRFLTFNLLCITLCLLASLVVTQTSQSLTIELDFITLLCDALAVLINIGMELIKGRVQSFRTILIFDLSGCVASMTLLIGVSVFGVVDAMLRSHEKRGHMAHVQHLDIMVWYSAFSVAMSTLSLSFFAYLRDKMLPPSCSAHDQLNIMSNLVHCVVDFVTNWAVLGTSLWLLLGSRSETRHESHQALEAKTEEKVHIDVFGAFVVCGCILLSVLVLLRDAFHTYWYIRALPEEKEKKRRSSAAKEFTTLSLGKHGAGSILSIKGRCTSTYGSITSIFV